MKDLRQNMEQAISRLSVEEQEIAALDEGSYRCHQLWVLAGDNLGLVSFGLVFGPVQALSWTGF